MSEQKDKPSVVVVGAGVSGLVAARNLADQGYDVTLREASSRPGGKIKSTMLNGKAVDLGAEFIDKPEPGKPDAGNMQLLKICNDLGVQLKPATDQDTGEYVLAGGKRISQEQFTQAMAPLQKQLAADKAALENNPSGARAREIDNMSLAQYLQSISGTDLDAGGLSKTAGKFNAWRQQTLSPDVQAIVAGAFAAEEGRDPMNISARQYVKEASVDAGQILESNCGYRVEGGMERVIDALKQDLERKGVNIITNSTVTGVSKDSNGFKLNTAEGDTVRADKVVFALPTKQLASVKGLEELGLSKQAVDTLNTAQYTRAIKFSVATKQDAPDANTYSSEGYQAWKTAPGVVTFLVNADTAEQQSPADVVKKYMDSYAKAHGTSTDKLFDSSKIVYGGPNMEKPCYCSPSVGQDAKLANLSREFDELAKSGVGIVGTYIPQEGKESIGFMENGVQSANRITRVMAQGQALEQETQWRDYAAAKRPAPGTKQPQGLA